MDLASGILLFGFVLTGYATWAAFMGGRWLKSLFGRSEQMIASAERSAVALFVLSSMMMAALIFAFVTRDLSLEYVAHYSSRTLPTFYTISAVWAGKSGSLLLWAWLLCLFAAMVAWQNRRKNRELLPYVLGTILFTAFFFFGRCSRGSSSPSAICSAPNGLTSNLAGVATGPGIRWRMPPSCRG